MASEENSSEIVKEMAESVAAANLKSLGDGPAFYHNFAMGNAVANQHGLQTLHATIIGKMAESIIATTPTEGGVDIAALGQLAKVLTATPPPTA